MTSMPSTGKRLLEARGLHGRRLRVALLFGNIAMIFNASRSECCVDKNETICLRRAIPSYVHRIRNLRISGSFLRPSGKLEIAARESGISKTVYLELAIN